MIDVNFIVTVIIVSEKKIGGITFEPLLLVYKFKCCEIAVLRNVYITAASAVWSVVISCLWVVVQ